MEKKELLIIFCKQLKFLKPQHCCVLDDDDIFFMKCYSILSLPLTPSILYIHLHSNSRRGEREEKTAYDYDDVDDGR